MPLTPASLEAAAAQAEQEQAMPPQVVLPKKLTKELRANYKCALQCAQLTESDYEAIHVVLRQAGCTPENPGAHVLCATTPEQVCVGACGGGQQDMSKWLTGAFGSPIEGLKRRVEREASDVGNRYWQCADECVREGVAVEAQSENAQGRALDILKRCGVVQLIGSYDLEALDRFQRGFDALKAKRAKYDKLLDQEQLHDGRYQVYLPFAGPFKNRSMLGANDLVIKVLGGYFGEHGFGIDHVSVLNSASPSGNQSLHPDIHYFKALTVSVHTALVDVTREMGPTFFCPCTGEVVEKDSWPPSAAIKMTILKQKSCFGPTLTPSFTARGTTTIYDGAMFHKGLDNDSGRDRPVLKLEVGAEGYPARRNYIQLAPKTGKQQTLLFREALGPPRMGGWG